MESDHEVYRIFPLNGGINDNRNESLISPTEAPRATNIDFNRDSVQSSGGSYKLGNRQAPHSAFRTSAPEELPHLQVDEGVSLPARGYAYFPYSKRSDIGGDGPSSLDPNDVNQYHLTRGSSFSRSFSFQFDSGEPFYRTFAGEDSGLETNFNDPDIQAFRSIGTFGITADECTILYQKGGDRLSPMSWAIGVVDVANKYELLTGSPNTAGSQYLPVFIWLDAPAWGWPGTNVMEYQLGNGIPTGGGSGPFATGALRAIVCPHGIQPGTRHHISVDLRRDSGTPGEGGTTAWAEDGQFSITVADEYGAATTYTGDSGLQVYKGPTDSLEYLEKYGVRYSGKDAEFSGLGVRQIPVEPNGNLVYGSDAACLERGGHKMVDHSITPNPPGNTLTIQKPFGTGNGFVNFNHRYLTTGNTATGWSPNGFSSAQFTGLQFNDQALRNYWGATWALDEGNQWNGVKFLFRGYYEFDPGDGSGAQYRINVGTEEITGAIGTRPVAVYPFRWRQKPFTIEGIVCRDQAIDYSIDKRAGESLKMHVELDDDTEPNLETIVSYWPMTDAGGGALQELVGGNTGYAMPFSLTKDGLDRVMLSGEGEAVSLDFSENPVIERQVRDLLNSDNRGFAVEVSIVLTEAYYALDETLADGSIQGKYAPDILSWDVKETSPPGIDHTPNPLLRLTHRARWTGSAGIGPTRDPMGFHARYSGSPDQEDAIEDEVFDYFDTSTAQTVWDTDAPWVGQKITLQLGVQPGVTAGTYDVYLSGHPKSHLRVEEGDDPDSEYQLWKKGVTISGKELERSVITIGGSWHPKALGYSELNCRLILDEVRVYGTAVPGSLTNSSGTGTQDGKIVGEATFRRGVLSPSDLGSDLGDGVSTATVTDGSSIVSAPGGTRFFTREAKDTQFSIKGAFLAVAGDTEDVIAEQALPVAVQDFYRVVDVSADGLELTLNGVYRDQSRAAALTRAFRILAYTSFADRLDDLEITLGRGEAFRVNSSTAEDATLTDELWANQAPTSVNWRMRVFSPLGGVDAARVVPGWARGVKAPRRNPILGINQRRGILYAGVQGALYEVDDRWRHDGPNEDLERSLLLRGERTKEVSIGLADDYVLMRGNEAALDITDVNLTWQYDVWVKMSDTVGIQTLWWTGTETEEVRTPGQLWARVRDGRPELGLGSLSTVLNGLPLGSFAFAVADDEILPDRWTHIRWQLGRSGTSIQDPKLFVNGKRTAVRVLKRPAGNGRDWVDLTDLPAAPIMAIGAARWREDVGIENVPHIHDEQSGLAHRPARFLGFIHNLRGNICGFSHRAEPGLFDQGNFNPNLPPKDSKLDMRLQNGVGHITPGGVGNAAILQASPFISLKHDMGPSTDQYSFASLLNRMYAVNGGRVAYLDRGVSKFLGVLKPTTVPKFEVERIPLLKENLSEPSPDGGENGPIRRTGSNLRLNHFNSRGNNYLTQNFHEELTWDMSSSTDIWGVFSFKCYIRLRSTTGRIPLYSGRSNLNSGGFFVEVRDGRLYTGWYDTLLKREVWVRTSQAVIEPGFVHYIHVRKNFPNGTGWSGASVVPTSRHVGLNWRNSVYRFTEDYTNDVMVVRRFPKAAVADADLSALDPVIGTERNCISFTTDDITKPSGTTAAGLVSDPTITFSTGGSVGTINASVAGLHPDMVGMYFQFGDDAGTLSGRLYRIANILINQTMSLRDVDTDTVADVAGVTAASGGVFSGIVLEKSDFYDASNNPDDGVYQTELFGSRLAFDIGNGVAPFNGEYWSYAYYVATHNSSEDVSMFEAFNATDRLLTGSDVFPEPIYDPTYPSSDGAGPGELGATGGLVFTEINTQPYTDPKPFPVTPQPNEDRSVDPGPNSSVNADTMFWRFLDTPDTVPGPTRISVVFYDRDQDTLSNPGPDLVVDPRQEDFTNASGDFRVTLKDLPVSRDEGTIERWIFASLPGGATKFLVAKVPDNTSSAVVINPSPIAIARAQQVLEYSNNAPPRCRVLGVSQGSLWFGNLTGRFSQEDGIMWSRPFFPGQVPATNFLPMVAEGTGEITAMRELKGRMIVYKRDGIWRITLDPSYPVSELVTTGTGCVALQSLQTLDDRHYFVSDRGPCVYLGQGLPAWIGSHVEEYYTSGLDERKAFKASAAVNRSRNQYVVTTFEDGVRGGQRISSEYDSESSGVATGAKMPARYRFSRYVDPALTSLGNVQPENGSVQKLVGGTEDGFLVWLDRNDTRGVLRGEGFAYGARTGVVQAGATESQVPIVWDRGDTPDPYLAGTRAQPVRICRDGKELVAPALFADQDTLLLDRSLDDIPQAGDVVSVGAQEHLWETGWLDLGLPEMDKELRYVDLVCQKESSGVIQLEVLADYDSDSVRDGGVVDLTDSHPRFQISAACGRHFKLRLRTPCPAVPVNFEITHIVVRFDTTDQT